MTQTGDKPYSCSECEEKFTDENDLIIHERTHTGEKLYSCSECEENFTDENDLIMHERTHTGDRPYSCSDCDEKFAVESDLTKHERTHTSDKPYSCCQCGEKFNVESDLNLHAQTHTGDLPHSCSQCEEKFAQESDLIKHERIHIGDKSFSCSQCEEKFAQETDLITHKVIHTCDKPLSCSQCEEKFVQETDLKQHETIHKSEGHSAVPNVTTDSERCKSCNQRQEDLTKKYKVTRNEVISKIRCEEIEAVIQAIIKSGSPSEYWRTVKEITSCKDCGQVLILEEKGEVISDPKMVATVMNFFFKDKIEGIEKEIPNLNINPTEKLEESLKDKNLNFSLKTVTERQVEKAIKAMKNKSSSGIDFISPKLVKMAVDVIKGPLCIIINASISEGEFPDSWKIGKITPIWKKKGSKRDKTMYRPVSLLRSASKVLEIVVNQQVLRFFEENHLLPKSQYGFRSKRSTFSAVAAMHETWLNNKVKKGQTQAVTFFDLSAAFDALSRDIFCSKIRHMVLMRKA